MITKFNLKDRSIISYAIRKLTPPSDRPKTLIFCCLSLF